MPSKLINLVSTISLIMESSSDAKLELLQKDCFGISVSFAALDEATQKIRAHVRTGPSYGSAFRKKGKCVGCRMVELGIFIYVKLLFSKNFMTKYPKQIEIPLSYSPSSWSYYQSHYYSRYRFVVNFVYQKMSKY